MSNAINIRHLFRRPVYPLLVDVDGHLIAARSEGMLAQQLSCLDLTKSNYDVIDSTSEGWTLDVRQMAISPLTFKNRWTKLEVIRLYNERQNKKEDEEPYPTRSLSSKRFDRILSDIVELTARA